MPATITRQPYGETGNLRTVSRYSWSDCGNFDHQDDPWIECTACGVTLSLPEHEDEYDDFDAEEAVHESGACVARAIAAQAAGEAEAAAALEAALLEDEPF